jgi:predicted CXXCH cytochrome family protein
MFQMPAGYLCLSCHDSIFGGQTPDNMHAADDIRSCDNCHVGHSSENENLLTESHPDLCLNCHKSLRGIMNNGLAHSPIPTDGCLPCHTTHFKKDGSALTMNLPQLCFECHPEIRELIDSDFPHAAVEEGCTSCHDPHQRFSDDDISELCSDCHDVEDDSFRKAHFNIDPGHCAACHDPHGSSSEKIMKAYEHPPFQDRDCGGCHDSDQDILEIKNDKLCLDCHDRPEATGGHVKELILNKICLDCHSPHASHRDFLIK